MPSEFVRSSFLVYLSEMNDYEMIAANASWYYAFSPGDIYRRDRAKAAMQVCVLLYVLRCRWGKVLFWCYSLWF
jgi:hypothetical protein